MLPHTAEHTAVTKASPEVLYGLIADAASWPAVFGPCVHVRYLERGPGWERFELWAMTNDEVRSWTSRRELDATARTVAFRQEHSKAPITAMTGQWSFRPHPDGTEIVLRHAFGTDGSAGSADWVDAALDRNSHEELAALDRVAAQAGEPSDEAVFSFADTVELPGPRSAVYDFVHRADLWAERLPHVARTRLDERPGDVQLLEMTTRTQDGATHDTRSIRVCERDEWIAYKQVSPPALLLGHSGLWSFAEENGVTRVTARHTAVLSPEGVARVLGPGTEPDEARAYVRDALSRNSRTTLEHAAGHVRSSG
ncbi:aromatase/cyclase [Amycolatopsis sp. H6(2020)]|nr:aromatase/cyclase [Amycolatopsis sp. H6(2020)]